ncbi:MAG: type II and III secretion system protein [Acidobacteriota bacterium]|nr:type II and III secretion system protein [Acidobacteriota bacterium]
MFNRLAVAGLLLVPSLGLCQVSRATAKHRIQSVSDVAPNPTGSEQRLAPKLNVKGVPSSSGKQKREADRAYLEGALHLARKDFERAQHSLEMAVRLDPDNRTYILALLYSREANVSWLVQEASKARMGGDSRGEKTMLAAARRLDPRNPIVAQYLSAAQALKYNTPAPNDHFKQQFAGPIECVPLAGLQSFHVSGEIHEVVREIYSAYGIEAIFDPSVMNRPFRMEVGDVDFANAARVLTKAGHLLFVPLDAKTALIAADTKENRETLMPLVDEMIYLPGHTQQQILELAALARIVFDMTQVTLSTENGAIAARGPELIVSRMHRLFAQLAEEETDVLLDIEIYEVDRTTTRNIGLAPPASASATDVAGTAKKLISDNQTLLSESISSGALTLSGSAYQQELEEVAFLVATGASGSSSFTSILGTVGSFDGVPLLGISIGSTTLNMLLNSSDVRMLNAIQIRSSDRQQATFQVGSRYPILTSVTTSPSSSTVASELAAAGVSSSVISQIVGSTSSTGTSTPQIGFEDLGLTLKVTPRVMRDNDVQLDMDFKLESLGGNGVDDLPILNNRILKSTVTIGAGQTTVLAASMSRIEMKALEGTPGLNDLPGFQSTDRGSDGTKNEILITVTPRIVTGSTIQVE